MKPNPLLNFFKGGKRFLALVFLIACNMYAQSGSKAVAFNMNIIDSYQQVSEKLDSVNYNDPLHKHSILLAFLKASKLDEVLDYDGDFTVFAPSNIAFEKIANTSVTALLDPKNESVLKSLLSLHIIPRKLTASSILMAMCRGEGSAIFTSIHGNKITATMNGLDIVLTDSIGNCAVVVAADIDSANVVVHEIDTVFLPKTLF